MENSHWTWGIPICALTQELRLHIGLGFYKLALDNFLGSLSSKRLGTHFSSPSASYFNQQRFGNPFWQFLWGHIEIIWSWEHNSAAPPSVTFSILIRYPFEVWSTIQCRGSSPFFFPALLSTTPSHPLGAPQFLVIQQASRSQATGRLTMSQTPTLEDQQQLTSTTN